MTQYGTWERPPPPYPQPYPQPMPNGTADVRERLVRCEETLRHAVEHLHATSARAQSISDRANATELRVQALESSDRLRGKLWDEIGPFLEERKRWNDRKKALRDVVNYVAIAVVILSAISGKISWKDATGLLKLFGLG